MTDLLITTRRRFQQLCLAAHSLADPDCKKPRPRLRQIRTMLEDDSIDLLVLVKSLLDEAEREEMIPARRTMWRKQTQRLARERKRRR